MSDLIKRLREADSNGRLSIGDLWNLCEEAADALEQQQWIPVSERLPEDDICVLVYGEDCLTEIDCFSEGGWQSFWSCGITHWMPLPQPPTAEDG